MSERNGILEAIAVTEAGKADGSMFGGTNAEEGQAAGRRFKAEARTHGFTDDDIKAYCRTLGPGDSVCTAYSSYTLQGDGALKRMHSEFILAFIKSCM